MTPARQRILAEIYRLLQGAFPDARYVVGRALQVDEDEKAGAVLIALQPGPETDWDADFARLAIAREWLVGVQVAVIPTKDDALFAWGELEAAVEDVFKAVEGIKLDGDVDHVTEVARLDLDPIEQPVAGLSIGMTVTYRVRYIEGTDDD